MRITLGVAMAEEAELSGRWAELQKQPGAAALTVTKEAELQAVTGRLGGSS